jgi:hypothetical protein
VTLIPDHAHTHLFDSASGESLARR